MKKGDQIKDKKRILIVDNHPVIREGLAQIINRETDLLVCAEAGTIEEAANTVRKQKIDLNKKTYVKNRKY